MNFSAALAAVLLDSSSLAGEIKAAPPDLKKVVPPDVDIRLDFDQPTYVTNSLFPARVPSLKQLA